jgi:hypothetical protein
MDIARRIVVAGAAISGIAAVVWAIGLPFTLDVLLGRGGWRAYWFFAGFVILPVAAAFWTSLIFVRFPGDD